MPWEKAGRMSALSWLPQGNEAMQQFTILAAGHNRAMLESAALPLKVRGFNAGVLEGEAAALEHGIAEHAPDILFLDATMAGAAGLAAALILRLPAMAIVALTGEGGEGERELKNVGACAAVPQPATLEGLMLALGVAMGHRTGVAESLFLNRNIEDLKRNYLNTARVLVNLIEDSNPELGGHCRRVAFYARAIGEQMGLPNTQLLDLEIAGLLHDTGKLALPERLQKAPLDELQASEVALMHRHPIFAQTVLSASEEFKEPAGIIRNHLEKLDGSGYPDHLSRDSIPLGAKILGVANAYDELKQRRLFTLEVFSSEQDKEEFAVSHLRRMAEIHFEPAIIEALEKAAQTHQAKPRAENVTVERLEPGMTVTTDIITRDGKLLVARGLTLNPQQVMRMRAFYDIGLLPREVAIEHPAKFK